VTRISLFNFVKKQRAHTKLLEILCTRSFSDQSKLFKETVLFPGTSVYSERLRAAVIVMGAVKFQLYGLLCSAYPNDLHNGAQRVVGSNL
jgi:hypothetical protein